MASISRYPRTCNIRQIRFGFYELTITEHLKTKSHVDRYTVEDLHSAPGLSVWRVEKFYSTRNSNNPDSGKYTVELCNDPKHSSCTCKGFEHGGKCRHISALHALIEGGRFPGIPGADYYDVDELDDVEALEVLEAEWHQGHDW